MGGTADTGREASSRSRSSRRLAALDQLLPLAYGSLRELAARQLRDERAGHTLQPTALVHEAYLKIVGGDPGRVETRVHFLALAAKAMRRILVDHARRRAAEKRAGDPGNG